MTQQEKEESCLKVTNINWNVKYNIVTIKYKCKPDIHPVQQPSPFQYPQQVTLDLWPDASMGKTIF